MISSLWPWALGPSILPYCFIVATIALFFLLWAYWPSFLPCQPILLLYSLGFLGPFTSSLHLFTLMGLLLNYLDLPSKPFYSIFTSYYSYGLIGHYSCHVNPFYHFILWASSAPFTSSLPLFTPLGLLLHSLSFLNPFISSLPLIIFMGLLAINLATLAH